MLNHLIKMVLSNDGGNKDASSQPLPNNDDDAKTGAYSTSGFNLAF